MRIEKLADNKIKVTLTAADMSQMNIDISQLTPASRELHTFLFNLMETVREETGFNPYNGQIVVEATPSSDGMSVTISKLKRAGKNFTKEQLRRAKVVRATVRRRDRMSDVFFFNSFDDLCGAFMRIEDGAFLHSMLYKLDGRYCFLIDSKSNFPASRHILSEFAVNGSRGPIRAEHVREHGELIAAGEKLAKMAIGIRELNI